MRRSWDKSRSPGTTSRRAGKRCSLRSARPASGNLERPQGVLANVAAMAEAPSDSTRIATNARDRVRFEEEALELSDQVYRVARRLTGSREEAEDLVQDTYARAFRAWQQYTPGTNLRAWLL